MLRVNLKHPNHWIVLQKTKYPLSYLTTSLQLKYDEIWMRDDDFGFLTPVKSKPEKIDVVSK